MSTPIRSFRVVVFEESVGPELKDVLRVLSRAGYRAVRAEDSARWRAGLEVPNCWLVMAYQLTPDLQPPPFRNGYVPPIVLVSPLRAEDAMRDLRDPRVVDEVLQPGTLDPLLLRAVTRGA